MTLDPDLEAQLKEIARERDVSFREVLNSTLRAGLTMESPAPKRFEVKARPLGARPDIDLSRALRLADQLEDQAVAHKLELPPKRDAKPGCCVPASVGRRFFS